MGWISKNAMSIRMKLNENAIAPTKAHESDAGFDLYAPRDLKDGMLYPRSSLVIDTGVCLEIPNGYVGMVKSKSGLNVKRGVQSEGVIDSGYTGSIVVKLYNHSDNHYEFQPGEKISQIVIMPITQVRLELVNALADSERGDGGFGSSGRF